MNIFRYICNRKLPGKYLTRPGIDANMKFHNTLLKLLRPLTIAGMAVLCLHVSETKADLTQNDAALREKSLIAAASTTDSIKILLDVYNMSDKLNRDRVRKQLINLASKTDNEEVISDVVKELSTSTDDTKDLKRLIEISEALPENSDKEPIQTVLQMEQARVEAPNVKDSQIEAQIADYKRQAMTISGNPYKEVQNIYRTMVYLGGSSQGPMYYELINRLGDVVESLPEDDHAIRNLYYTNAAIFYTRKRDYAKAIEFDRKLIHQLDEMKKHFKEGDPKLDELDYFYYVSYRRMLRNFRGLSPEDIEFVYNKCVEIAGRNESAREEFGNSGLTKSYYYYATGQYPLAVPELKKALSEPAISDFRKQELLGLLGYAYRQTGNKEGELQALRDYVTMSLADREKRRDDMYRELQLRNSVSKVLSDEMIQQEQQKEENRVMRKTSLTLVYVLAVILIFLCQAYFRLRHKVRDLETRNQKLHRNIEYIFDDGVPKGAQDLRHQKNRLKG